MFLHLPPIFGGGRREGLGEGETGEQRPSARARGSRGWNPLGDKYLDGFTTPNIDVQGLVTHYTTLAVNWMPIWRLVLGVWERSRG